MARRCATGKFSYASASAAQAHLDRLRRRADEHPARLRRLSVYVCRTCRQYHVGHEIPPPRRRGKYQAAKLPPSPVYWAAGDAVKILVENFQSLGRVEIEARGLTVLVGPSDRGKSALIRAVEAALFNRPGDTFVRIGAKAAVVEVSHLPAVDGTAHTVRWRKGKSINEFTIDEAKHTRVGQSAPQPLAGFGYKDIFVGDKDRKQGEWVRPQVASQFEPLFLLTRPGSFIADVLNLVTRHAVLQTAVGRAAGDLAKQKSAAGTLRRLRDEAEVRGTSLEPVPAFLHRVAELRQEDGRLLFAQQRLDRLRVLARQRLATQQVVGHALDWAASTTLYVEAGMAVVTAGRLRQTLQPVVRGTLLPEWVDLATLNRDIMAGRRVCALAGWRSSIQDVPQTLPDQAERLPVYPSEPKKVEALHYFRVKRAAALQVLRDPLPPEKPPVSPVFAEGLAMRDTIAPLRTQYAVALGSEHEAGIHVSAIETLVIEASTELAMFKASTPVCPACERPWGIV